ncbi:endonuclease/exonuclease/phosphatase family protein [Caulobacter sp.]|uniref:endonuclease/exonuclease/phosphatase family protein n=1 Tax=Caulobacter sp. TaxID=78 RepID=UPI003BAB7E08
MDLLLRLLSLMFRGTALMLGLAGTVLALASLGGAFSDQLDALTHFAPFWLAMGLAAVVLGSVFARGDERRAMVGLGLIAVVACSVLMGPDLLAAARAKRLAARADDLKIIQFNVWHDNRTPGKATQWLLDQDADVVVLVEGGGRSSPVVKAMKAYYPFLVSCAGKRVCDTWIFSKKRMIARAGLYEEGRELPGAWATLADPKGAFTVAGVHYVWPVPAGPQQQQVKRMTDAIARFDKSSTIVTGDFNSTPWSFTMKRQDKAFGLERRTHAMASWPSGKFSRIGNAPAPFLPIDQVYAGSSWKTVSVERGPALGSDHRPVIVRLRRIAP